MNSIAEPRSADARAVTARRNTGTFRLVRQLHLWIGAWGALAAILFGLTGLVMNHRFGDSPWPQGKAEESGRLAVEVPASAQGSPEALSAWLAAGHGLSTQVVRKSKPETATLGGREVTQPPRWTLSGGTAGNSWSMEYVPGNASAEVKQSRHSALAALNRLHKGVGGGGFWILLSDSFAIGMLLLGVSGIWMWARGRSMKDMLLSVMGLSTLLFLAIVGLAIA
jgi:hypothetical protein